MKTCYKLCCDVCMGNTREELHDHTISKKITTTSMSCACGAWSSTQVHACLIFADVTMSVKACSNEANMLVQHHPTLLQIQHVGLV